MTFAGHDVLFLCLFVPDGEGIERFPDEAKPKVEADFGPAPLGQTWCHTPQVTALASDLASTEGSKWMALSQPFCRQLQLIDTRDGLGLVFLKERLQPSFIHVSIVDGV